MAVTESPQPSIAVAIRRLVNNVAVERGISLKDACSLVINAARQLAREKA